MFFPEVFRSFVEQSPVSVMFRGTLEHVFSPERLDQLFKETAQRQASGELSFSTCAELLSLVVSQTRRSVHAAYRAQQAKIAVSVQSIYNKLAGIEPCVSEALVRDTASDLAEVVQALKAKLPGPLPGYEVRIADGNYLAGTQHRLMALRHLGDAALPGHTLAVLNPHLELIEGVGFCLAVVMYNALSTVMAALRVAHPQVFEQAEGKAPASPIPEQGPRRSPAAVPVKAKPRLSFYYLADEIAGVSRGMAIIISNEDWSAAFAQQSPQQLAAKLIWLARKTDLKQFLANPYRPQKRRKRRPMTTTGSHVSTYRILEHHDPPPRTTKC